MSSSRVQAARRRGGAGASNEHGIAGMSWWNASTGEISYFGDVRTILQRGIGDFVRSFLLHLNHDYLTAPTLFQIVERHELGPPASTI